MTYNDFQIVGASNQEEPREFDPQRTLNMYAITDQTGKKPLALTSAPGTQTAILFNQGTNVRSLIQFGSNVYAVVEENVYKVDQSLDATLLGVIGTTQGYVGMAHNDTQVILVDGNAGYIIENDILNIIVDPQFPGQPTDVTYIDTYFVVTKGETNEWYISFSGDGTQWNVLSEMQIISKPDTLIGCSSLHRLLFLFGKVSTEVWYNAGTGIDNPFQRQNNMLLEYGCTAPGTIAFGFDKLFWLGNDEYGFNSVMMTDGTRPQKVSTRPVEIAIKYYENKEDARGFVYKENGHVFYVLSFTSGNHTWVYDASTQMWHEREMQDGSRFIADCHVFFNNKHYIGHHNAPIISEMSKDLTSYNGDSIHRQRITSVFSDPTYKKIRIDRLEVDIRSGFVPTNGTSSDPKLFFSVSRDGGQLFQPAESLSIGREGDRTKRTIFRRKGTARSFAFKFDYYADSLFDILGAAIKYEVLPV